MIVSSESQDNLYCVEESYLFHGQGGWAGTCSSVTHDDSAWFPSANFREAENKRVNWGGAMGREMLGRQKGEYGIPTVPHGLTSPVTQNR